MTSQLAVTFHSVLHRIAASLFLLAIVGGVGAEGAEEWTQFKFDSGHSGNVGKRNVTTPLGLVGALPLTDAVYTSPVVSEGRVYVLDGAGVLTCADADSLDLDWRYRSPGGEANCNNISSPAIVGNFVHFGTTSGTYCVLNKQTGEVVKELACGDPIFGSPVVVGERVYFVTLGSRVHAIHADGTERWVWDFVKEELGFQGDRWKGDDWRKHRDGKLTRFDQFLCSRSMVAHGRTLVIPAGGTTVWLEDRGDHAERIGKHITGFHDEARSPTPTLGLSLGDDGTAYRQWHWLDNIGQVDMLRVEDGNVSSSVVAGTESNTGGGLLSFSSVSVRGQDVFRVCPKRGFGLCRHQPGQDQPDVLAPFAATASPVLLKESAVYGDLLGRLHVVPIADGKPWSFDTPFGKSITAPAAVCDGRVYFGCEDGYLYVLGPEGTAKLPTEDLKLAEIRTPLTGKLAGDKYNRFTSFRDWSNSNSDQQDLKPPLRMKWVRRYEGTAKHFSTFGGGRMYTHTAEGQVFAVEESTGRLLWRVYHPGVHISYTSPLYHKGRLLIPQAGREKCRLRCLDAATGRLIWEAPFSGSPSWNRQLPPIISGNLAIYGFSTARYDADAPRDSSGEEWGWLFGHQNNARFPADQKPLLRAYDLETGDQVWEKDFSEHGSGGDESGWCLLDGTLYYTCFFGHSARRRGRSGPSGLTAAINPETGETLWLTTKHSMNGGCTISAAAGRLYLGGYNPVGGTTNRHVWCLDARDGSLIWQSEPLKEAIQVVTVGSEFLFVHAQYKNGYLLDKSDGHIVKELTHGYRCTRFTMCGTYLLGSNMDVLDLRRPDEIELISTGPRVDVSECIGAVISNGRLFYTAHGAGIQVSQVYGDEAENSQPPWRAE